MTRIDPERLRGLRERKNWSQAQLAEKTKNAKYPPIDKQTIWRIERGVHRTTRQRIVEQLADALNVAPTVLTGEAPMPELRAEHSPPGDKSQLNVRLGTASRNALTLAAQRYGISAADIVELAPFLFCWAAEKSLNWRAGRISHFEQTLDQARKLGREIQHLNYDIVLFTSPDEMIGAERESIEQRDIWGLSFNSVDFNQPTFDEDDTPFAEFLRHLASEFEDVAVFERWSSWGPEYRICPEEAAALVGGDQELAGEILEGRVALNEMPKELRETVLDRLMLPADERAKKAKERAAWVRSKAEEAKSELDLADLLAVVDEGESEK